MINPMDLSNRKILITGASSGIGRATAILLSQLGAICILVARRTDELEKTAAQMDNKALIYPFDLEKVEDIAELTTRINQKTGPLDGFVHSAGISITFALRALRMSMLEKSMRVNFYSFLEIAKQISKAGYFNAGLSIVAISSVAAQQGNTGRTIYCASKAALDASIRCLAKELASKHIRVNSIVPGLIQTDIFENLLDRTEDSQHVQSVISRQYLGIGEPEDVAYMAAFLLSPATKFVTGSAFPVDGGRLSS